MRCEACQGSGFIRRGHLYDPPVRGGASATSCAPCAECQGSGIAHCCEPQAMPDQARNLKELEQAIGDRVICSRCGATLDTYAEACTAALDERCPGLEAIECAPSPDRSKREHGDASP